MQRRFVDPEFPAKLRQLRAQRGLSQRDLGQRAHYGKSYISELERGSKDPTVEAAERLDQVLAAGGSLAGLVSPGTAPSRVEIDLAPGLGVALPRLRSGGRGRIGARAPGRLIERTARLRRLDDFLGGADTYTLYRAEVDDTADAIRDGQYAESTGIKLLAVLGEQAQMAGWAAFDAGMHDEADQLYRMSLAAARDAGDPALEGNAWSYIAYQQLGLSRPGLDAAIASVELAGPGVTPRVRALLHSRRAWAHALLGQAAEAEEQLALASTCLTEVDDRPEPDWVYWVDGNEMEIMTGRCWSVLHRPVRAITVLERVLAGYEETHARDKALYLSWLADAYLEANETEQACLTAGRALRLCAGVGSVRPGRRLDLFLDRLAPYENLPSVVELRALASELATTARLTSAATPDTPPPPPQSEQR